MSPFKKTILFIHRWLGLISGLVVVIVSITGCLFAFQYEITQWIRHDLIHADSVKPSQPTLPLPELRNKAAEKLRTDHLTYGITTYKDPSRNWSVLHYVYQPGSRTYFGSIKEYKTLYINPYNGNIEGIVDEENDFFQIVKGIHWSLLLATPIGQPVVVWSTVIFLILLITGFILWWPKRWNKAGRQRSFKIKWGSSWRRINYDLHNVLGFYFLTIALLIGLTGLYWYFPSAKKALHFIGTGEFMLPETPPKYVSTIQTREQAKPASLDIAYEKAWSKFPDADRIEFTSPVDSLGTITATIRADSDTYYEKSMMYFDQYTGDVIHSNPYSEKNTGEKLLAMNYDIHVGAIAGLPGKIIAFLASLLCASLPVTGFLIWWDRQKRKKKSASKPYRKHKRRLRNQSASKELVA